MPKSSSVGSAISSWLSRASSNEIHISEVLRLPFIAAYSKSAASKFCNDSVTSPASRRIAKPIMTLDLACVRLHESDGASRMRHVMKFHAQNPFVRKNPAIAIGLSSRNRLTRMPFIASGVPSQETLKRSKAHVDDHACQECSFQRCIIGSLFKPRASIDEGSSRLSAQPRSLERSQSASGIAKPIMVDP